MAGEPEESWGTAPLESLIALLQSTTGLLRKAHETVAMDEIAYQRKFWTTWRQLDPTLSVAAMNRYCEDECSALNEEWIMSRSILAGITAKQHALIAAIGSRV